MNKNSLKSLQFQALMNLSLLKFGVTSILFYLSREDAPTLLQKALTMRQETKL